MKFLLRAAICATLCLFMATTSRGASDDEISLYDSSGKPVAYIAEDLTIFLWSGKPVAYLDKANSGWNVYGFNGKHLGWFKDGIIRNHDGDGACGVRGVVNSPQYEPYKAYKEYEPYKAYKEYAPYEPSATRNWSNEPCSLFLRGGTK